jgi:hypothetical protein
MKPNARMLLAISAICDALWVRAFRALMGSIARSANIRCEADLPALRSPIRPHSCFPLKCMASPLSRRGASFFGRKEIDDLCASGRRCVLWRRAV